MSARPADDPALPTRDLVLVGGGHAHVIALRMLAMDPPPSTRITLISDSSSAFYSGMIPGCVGGLYTPEETRIDLRPLARFAGARFLEAEVVGLDPGARRIQLAGRPPLRYDVLGIDVGSTVRGLDVPGVLEHAIPTRPIGRLMDRLEAAEAALAGREGPTRVAIVGGGSAGVELAFCLEARWAARGLAPEVTLLDANAATLPEHGARVAAAVTAEATARGIRIVHGFRAAEVRADAVVGEDGTEVPADAVVWATGGAPHPFLADMGLATDDRGFLEVGPTLQATDHPEVFATGDCIGMVGHRIPKAGVYAVRQGPVLARNLRAFLEGRAPERYAPQHGFLALLATGDARAVLSWKGLAARGAWVWRLKDWIDRRFMARFSAATLRAEPMDRRGGWEDDAVAMPPMRCLGCGAKVGGTVLSRVMDQLEVPTRPSVKVGLDAPDDAAVVEVPAGKLQAQTLDFFPAPLDDPYVMGRIATLHAASDLFAMGATPDTAMVLATLPFAHPRLQEGDLLQLMGGIVDALREMGAALVGGHTTEGADLAVGLAFTGILDATAATKGGLREGDALILTKPLGTGLLLAADMQLRAEGPWIEAAVASMLASNQAGARVLAEAGCTALTDVTGFGLAGHLVEMLRAGEVGAALDADAIPLLPGVEDSLAAGVASTLDPENRRLLEEGFELRGPAAPRDGALFDPQTSGGLLAGVAAADADAAVAALRGAGYPSAAVIGAVTDQAGILELRR